MNTFQVVQDVTRKSLKYLHEKGTFIGTVDRSYDDRFARTGAKIGSKLNVRNPVKFQTTVGANAAPQDISESTTPLVLATQRHVDILWNSVDWTLSMDDISIRYIEPMMAELATMIEADGFASYTNVYQTVGSQTSNPADITPFLNAKLLLNRSLCPKDSKRNIQINSATSASTVAGLKTLFQDSVSLSKQYLEGRMFRTSGFDFFENENIAVLTNGHFTGTPQVNGASQLGNSLVTSGWNPGDIMVANTVFTVPGSYMVHPETKANYGTLQQFVCTQTQTADAGGNMTIPINPGIQDSSFGAYQNVTASPTNGQNLTIVGASDAVIAQNLAYHEWAFAMVTADLLLPENTVAYRTNFDGISMRAVKQYDIKTDQEILRIDVLYGWACLRPELACRILSPGAVTLVTA